MALTRITQGVIKPNENYDTHNINSTGIVTAVGANFTGNVSVGGTLTYEDVTSIDSVGIITAQNGIDCNGDLDVDGHTNLDNVSVAGIVTASGDIFLPDNQKLKFGNTAASPYTEIVYSPSDNYTDIVAIGGTIRVAAEHISLNRKTASGTQQFIFCDGDNGGVGTGIGNVNLYQNGDRKFRTLSSGVQVESAIGDTYLTVKAEHNDASSDAILLARVTNSDASSYLMFGDTADTDVGRIRYNHYNDSMNFRTNGVDGRLIINSSGNVSIANDLDVDGHTNLDNVSIAGVTTFAGAVTTGDHITLTGQNPRITFTDTNHNPDFEIYGSAGIFQVWDSTNAVGRLIVNSDGHIDIPGNLDCGANLDVDGHTNLDNVSIAGVTTATGNLTVQKSSATDTKITVESTGTNSYPTFRLKNDARSYDLAIDGATDAFRIYDVTGTIERLRITSDGRIGMHDSSPNDYELDIMKRSTATDANIRLYNNATGSSNDTIMRFHIAGTSAKNIIYFGDGDDSNIGMIRYHHSDDSLEFTTGGSERLRINSSGIDVTGSITADDLRTDNSQTFYLTSANDFRFRHTGGSERLRINSSGIDVTGTAIADALNVTGTSVVATLKSTNNNYVMQMQGNNATDKVYFGTTSGNDFIIANTSSVTQRLIIDSNGDVGINETNPTEKLHVSGNIKVTGQIFQSTPADFWSISNTFIELNGLGNLTHMGSYETCLTSNGYRDNNAQWKSYGINGNTGAAQIRLNPAGTIIFGTEANKADGDTPHVVDERLRITSGGEVLINESTARSYVDGAGNTQTPKLQVEADDNTSSAISLTWNSGGGSAGRRASFMFARTADGSAVSSNSVLGEVLFMGEGNSTLEKAASIRAEVDGAPGTNDMPGRLIFSTSADGSDSPTERLRITSSGRVNIGGNYSQNNDQLHIIANTGKNAIGFGATTQGMKLGWDGDNSSYDSVRIFHVDYSNSSTYGIAGNNPTTVIQSDSIPGSGTVNSTFWFRRNNSGNFAGRNIMNVCVDGDVTIGGAGEENGASITGVQGSKQSGFGVSKLTIQPDDRTTAFNASDGDTWHDVVIKQRGGATNNAVGIAFQVADQNYHKNAGTGICAIKNGTNSDYGADLAFITRPQSATSKERVRIKSTGIVEFKGAGDSTEQISIQSSAGGAQIFMCNYQGVNAGDSSSRLGVGKDDNALIFINAQPSSSQVQNFAIGTSDTTPLVLSTNNTQRFRIGANGQIGMGQDGNGTVQTRAVLELCAPFNDVSDNDGSADYTMNDHDALLINFSGASYSSGTNVGSIAWTNGGRRRAAIMGEYQHTDGDYLALSFFTRGSDGANDFYRSFIINHNGSAGLHGALSQSTSDDRLKKDKVEITNALDKVNTLSSFTHKWNDIAVRAGLEEDKEEIGLSAQEVQGLYPCLVDVNNVMKDPEDPETDYLTVHYAKVVPLLVASIKELTAKNKALEARLDALESS